MIHMSEVSRMADLLTQHAEVMMALQTVDQTQPSEARVIYGLLDPNGGVVTVKARPDKRAECLAIMRQELEERAGELRTEAAELGLALTPEQAN